MARTAFQTTSRFLSPERAVICLASAALLCSPILQADAVSSNTLSLTLTFSPAQTNLFGYSELGAFAVNGAAVQPGGNNGGLTVNPAVASFILTAPQDVISVSPTNAASKTTDATMGMELANISGSGDGSAPAQPFPLGLAGSFTYDLNDSLVDNPPFDSADSALFVQVVIGGVVAYTDNISAADPQNLSGTVIIPFGNYTLPANSLTALTVSLELDAAVASSLPPPNPPVVVPVLPMTPSYLPDPIPEPSSLTLVASGICCLAWFLRRKKGKEALDGPAQSVSILVKSSK